MMNAFFLLIGNTFYYTNIVIINDNKILTNNKLYIIYSPFSDGGLYINLVTFLGYGERYLLHDVTKTGSVLYLHSIFRQIKKEIPTEQPKILGIAVEGGFAAGSNYDVIKEYTLVVVRPDQSLHRIDLSNSSLPEFVKNVCNAIIEHAGSKSANQV
jgi:hypothetical protein